MDSEEERCTYLNIISTESQKKMSKTNTHELSIWNTDCIRLIYIFDEYYNKIQTQIYEESYLKTICLL